MIKVQNGTLTFGSNSYPSQIPRQCPKCSDKNTPDRNASTGLTINGINYYMDDYICKNCDAHFIVLRNLQPTSSYGFESKILQTYPSNLQPEIPQYMIEISPRSSEIYKGAYLCEDNGLIDNAGSGYRNCMEILIKDYLISVLNEDPLKISKMKLIKAIELLPSIPLQQSADVVRIIGNNLTHYENKLDSNEFELLKQYLYIVIKFLELDYMARNPKYVRQT